MKKILFLLLIAVLTFQVSVVRAQCNGNAPIINTFSPNTGFIGSTVTITGANFDPTPANNKVYFGATKATVLTSSFGVITATAPVGATTALISVTNGCNLTAYSKTPFNGIFCPTPINAQTYNNNAFILQPSTNGGVGVNGAYNMMAQDLDLDGKPEVISAYGGVTVARNTSTPGNLSFVGVNFSTVGGYASHVSSADFDGDGKRDLFTTQSFFRNVSTGPGNINFVVTASGFSGYQSNVGDFNNDGKIDVVYNSGSTMYFYRNTSSGPGNISFTYSNSIFVNYNCTGIQCADVDGDGKTDVLSSQGDGNRSISIRNTTTAGATTFTFEALEAWPSNGSYPYRCQIADFDKDGRIDLTTCNFYNPANTAIYRNTSTPGDISFAATVNLPALSGNYRIQVGDVNGDGYPDIVTKSTDYALFSVFPNTTTTAGNITFGSRFDYPSAMAEVSGLVIGDLDGDFVPDIATSGSSSNTIRFHRNTSAQTDNTLPTAACKNITVALSPSGTVTVTPQMIDNGSSDACGIGSLEINNASSVTFTCANIGANTVTLKVTDKAGNVSTCTATVNVAPAAIIVSGQTTVCQGQTVTMNANLGDSYQWFKNGVIIPGATSQTYVATTTGDYSVTVTNAGGCSGTSSETSVTVNNNPTVSTTPSGNASLCPPGGSVTLSATLSSIYQWKLNGNNIANATQQTLTVNAAGTYAVQVIDLFGCSATSDPIVVSATDNVPPVARCKNVTVQLSAAGTASVSAVNVNDGSTDNCGIASVTLSGTTFYNCSHVGQTIPVTLTVTDNAGNISSCVANVTVTGGVDTDGDGISDVCDADDDNDGITDVAECNNSNFYWSNAPTQSGNTATGVINGVGYTYTSSKTVETSPSVFAHSVFPASYNVPNIKCILNQYASNNTLTFASPISNPVLVFSSIGGGPISVPIEFSNPIQILWANNTVVQNSPTRITGTEGYAIVRLNGTFSSISFNYLADEYYVNFLFGADFQTCGDTDGDGTFDYLDTDSDNDGCPDAIEGSQSPSLSLTNNGRLTGAVDANGVPVLVNGGQGVGTSKNANANCFCQPEIDETGPSISCPGNLSTTATSAAGTVVNYTTPVGTDNCPGAVTTLVSGLPSGATFPIGTTTVKYRVTDAAGLTDECAFTVSVTGLAPSIVCPGNIAVNNATDKCGANASFAATESTGIPASTITYSHQPGSFFPVGTTTVTATATNAVGTSSCTFTVTVTDNQAPVFGTTVSKVAVFGSNSNTIASYLNANGFVATDFGYNSNPAAGSLNGYHAVILSRIPGNATTKSFVLNGGLLITEWDASAWALNTAGLLNATDGGGNYIQTALPITFSNNTLGNLMTVGLGNPYSDGGGTEFFRFLNNIGSGVTVIATRPGNIPVIIGGPSGSGYTLITGYDWQDMFYGNIGNSGIMLRNALRLPVLTSCPSDVTVNATGNCTAVVNYATPTPLDNCPGVTVTRTAGLASGAAFPLGSTVVTYEAEDASGNTATCSFTVTVKDVTPPSIVCPANISTLATSAAGAVVNYATPVGADNCSATTVMVGGLASGSTFPIGTTTVTYKVTDGAGLTAQCSFNVTVTGLPPVIACPSNIVVNNGVGQCGANVTFAATETTAIPASTITYSHQPGSFFAVGTTTVTATATNAVGSSSCTFTVTVNDVTPPVITCPFDIVVNAEAGVCGATVSYNQPSATDNCGGGSLPTSIPGYTYKGTFGGHTYFVSNNMAKPEAAHAAAIALGGHLATISDGAENALVSGFLPNQPMWIGYTDRDVEGTYRWITNEPVTYTNWASGEPNNAGGNEDWAVINWANSPKWNDWYYDQPAYYVVEFEGGNIPTNLVSGPASGSFFPVGTTIVTWNATDGGGNTVSCSFKVTVKDVERPQLVGVPGNVTVECNAVPAPAVVTATDNCSGVGSVGMSQQIISGNCPGNYRIIRTWTVSDAHGNSTSAVQTITVVDTQAPSITTAAADMTVECDGAGNTGALNAWLASHGGASASDACGSVSWTHNFNGLSDDCGRTGSATVTFTAKDQCGNTSTTTATFTIIDTQAPTINAAAADLTVECDGAGNTGALNAWLASHGGASASDACGSVSWTHNFSSLSDDCGRTGSATVTFTAKDECGNTSTTTATFTIIDRTAPVISCPADVTVSCQDDKSTSALGSATASDICSGVSITSSDVSTQNPDPNTPGHYNYKIIRTWTATDECGNSTSCVQTIKVQDVTAPVAICQNVTVTLASGSASITPDMLNNGSSDNCNSPLTLSVSKSSFNCSNIGANTVVLTVKDVSGNTTTCTATVTVVGEIPTCSITSIPTDNTYTGGVSTNLYLGYGAKSTTLQVNAPATGAPYTYSWTGTGLSNTNTGNPVFTPTTAGVYNFVVNIVNKYGCTTSCSISICVTDIRVVGRNGQLDDKKVYICHIPPGNPGNAQTLEVSVNAVPAHIGPLGHATDRLGKCTQTACTANNTISKAPTNTAEPKDGLNVVLSPNPTSKHFVLQVISSDRKTPVTLRVMDGYGRMIESQKGTVDQLYRFGSSYINGTYYIEVMQGENKKVVQGIKVK